MVHSPEPESLFGESWNSWIPQKVILARDYVLLLNMIPAKRRMSRVADCRRSRELRPKMPRVVAHRRGVYHHFFTCARRWHTCPRVSRILADVKKVELRRLRIFVTGILSLNLRRRL